MKKPSTAVEPRRAAAADQDAERALVDEFLRRRDETAFRRLYAAHTPFLYRLAYRLMRCDRQAAEEAVQDVWLRAAERLQLFRWDSSLRTWLAGFAINRCREELRRNSGAAALPRLVESSAVDPGPPSARVDLERAIASLPDGCREVLVLHDVEGHTHREIGALLGIDEGTSKSQLARARRAVRSRLDPAAAGEGGRRREKERS